MTDKSEGPYKLEQVRKTENSNEWFYRVVGPDGFLKIGNLPELNQYFIDLKVAYAAGFKAGLERAEKLVETMNLPPQKPGWWEYSKSIRAEIEKI